MGATVVLLVALLAAVLRLTRTLRSTAPASIEERQEQIEEPVAIEPDIEGAADAAGEPFEKDGRWWFQRGAVLLVYDAGTGEWVPASTEDSADPVEVAVAREPPVAADATWEPAEMDATPEPTVVPPAHEDPADGTFWKCPSCGAVNGSVSATCRMCFAARP